jgi:haloalkane dehalogenase
MAGAPADIYTMVSAYHDWLLETEKPKLLFWAKPGGLISPDKAAWYQTRLKNCQSIGVGEGIHYLQEHHPEAIGKGIAKWLSII